MNSSKRLAQMQATGQCADEDYFKPELVKSHSAMIRAVKSKQAQQFCAERATEDDPLPAA